MKGDWLVSLLGEKEESLELFRIDFLLLSLGADSLASVGFYYIPNCILISEVKKKFLLPNILWELS